MRRIKIEFSYDGRNFFGYQVLKDKRTVQGTLQNALSELLGEEIKVVSSGRTDAGVSAIKQVAHFDTNSTIVVTNICFAVNKLLPEDLQVSSSKNVSENFHSRYMAKSKTYKYMVYQSQQINCVYQNYMYRCDKALDLNAMKKASNYLIGKHNYKSFATFDKDVKNYERQIYSIEINQKDNIFSFEINGNAFLYNMIRIIIGTLLDVGTGKIAESDVKKILESKDRRNAGKLLPPYPLFLVDIFY